MIAPTDLLADLEAAGHVVRVVPGDPKLYVSQSSQLSVDERNDVTRWKWTLYRLVLTRQTDAEPVIAEVRRLCAERGITPGQLLAIRQEADSGGLIRWTRAAGVCVWCLTRPLTDPDGSLCARCSVAFWTVRLDPIQEGTHAPLSS